jgi:hypothetical protein
VTGQLWVWQWFPVPDLMNPKKAISKPKNAVLLFVKQLFSVFAVSSDGFFQIFIFFLI